MIGGAVRIEKLSAIAELVSAVAIVLTLGYLAVETQQNTAAIQATVRQSMLSDDVAILLKQMDYPHVMPGAYGGRDLTADEEVQLMSWLIAFIRTRENHWLQYQYGVIDEATWASYRAPLGSVLSQRFSRSFWEARIATGAYAPGFVGDVNGLLADIPIQTATTAREAMGLDP